MQETKELKVLAVNVSKEKGTIKHPEESITLDKTGIVNDAHAGAWHRQVSLLANESVNKFSSEAGRKINYGEFGENITTEGFELYNTSPLDKLISSKVELEVTQIGKGCHGSKCAIYREIGDCVMPREGIFARVIKPGKITPGDVLVHRPRLFTFQIITLSDRAARGDYEDLSGKRIIEIINEHYEKLPRHINIEHTIIPDEEDNLVVLLERSAATNTDVLITTGGTGIGKRDITVETVKPMLDKEIPGIMENIRIKYGAQKPNALLSRGVAGLMNNTLVYTLPGSVKAVNEYMTEILKTLDHLVYMKEGLDAH